MPGRDLGIGRIHEGEEITVGIISPEDLDRMSSNAQQFGYARGYERGYSYGYRDAQLRTMIMSRVILFRWWLRINRGEIISWLAFTGLLTTAAWLVIR